MPSETNLKDPSLLLHALWDILVAESKELEGSSPEQLQEIVERKDALIAQLGAHPALKPAADGTLRERLSADAIQLLENCNKRNLENGERINQRRKFVQERLARINSQGTYESSGSIRSPQSGNWSTQA